jgi:hypothetical protein
MNGIRCINRRREWDQELNIKNPYLDTFSCAWMRSLIGVQGITGGLRVTKQDDPPQFIQV